MGRKETEHTIEPQKMTVCQGCGQLTQKRGAGEHLLGQREDGALRNSTRAGG